MLKIKGVLRITVLYVASIMLMVAPSMAAFAAEDETYYYDEANGRWNTSKWVYDPATNTYKPAIAAETPPPEPEQSTEETPVQTEEESVDSSAAVISELGPSSNNTIDSDKLISSDVDISNDTTINNELNSDANTGNAGVKYNSNAGDATTGDASADATIVNSVHSTVGDGETSGIAHFTIDLYGDVHGDIVIGPSMANAEIDKNTNINSDTNIDNNSSITNDINLSANSGDAEVTSNTVAGSATSGDANAVANLLNLVNTVIGANKSFIGTINIHGNLNGDILISPEFIPQLLADNATVENSFTMPLTTNVNDDQTIINNVNLEATSGTATVKDNTAAGNATAGTAQTDLQILNMTGHEIVAENSVLVFVNVKGKWVGMIFDAPGATAAAFGSGVISHDTTLSDTTNVNNDAKITNNINLAATSGDATVEGNTSGGNATTGNARASANIANISSSVFKLSGWFAVLFINIDGDWNGWALVDTEAGTIIRAGQVAAAAGPPSVGAPNVSLGFRPKNDNPAVQSLMNGESASGDQQYAAAVLASTKNSGSSTGQPTLIQTMSPREDPFSVILMVSGFTVAGASGVMWAVRRWLEYRAGQVTL